MVREKKMGIRSVGAAKRKLTKPTKLVLSPSNTPAMPPTIQTMFMTFNKPSIYKNSVCTAVKIEPKITNFFNSREEDLISHNTRLTRRNNCLHVANGAVMNCTSESHDTHKGSHNPEQNGFLHYNSNEISPLQTSPPTPHKIQLVEDDPSIENEELRMTPSTKLSKMKLTSPGNVKRTTNKTGTYKRRLNLHQSQNQEPPAANIVSNREKASPKNMKQTTMKSFFNVRRSVRKTKATLLKEQQRSLEESILAEQEDGLKVCYFNCKGRGVQTTRLFRRGEFVIEYAGTLLDTTEARDRESRYGQDLSTGCYMYYFAFQNRQFCVDATPESGKMGRLVNHSRNGNLETKVVPVKGIPRLVLIAKRDIQQGEELHYDYGDRSKESLKYHPWLGS